MTEITKQMIFQAGRQSGKSAAVQEAVEQHVVKTIYMAGQADGSIPKIALSIKQPWSWLIVQGVKDIENRNWMKKFPPRILVHAGQSMDEDAHRALLNGRHPATDQKMDPLIVGVYRESISKGLIYTGGFVGVTDIIGVQEDHDSDWFMGDYGYVLANAKPLPFLPWRGQLGFFAAEVTPRSIIS